MHEFDDILINATQSIEGPYFQLPIAGAEDPIYRERVYCYELYHQMRSRWPENCPYSLGGEIDKAGHPLIRGNGLDGLKPDFLVHIPGNMDGNYAVIEVKPITALVKGLEKDIETLTAFRDHGDYQRGLLLIYGVGGIANMAEPVAELIQGVQHEVEIWSHPAPGETAIIM